MVKRNTLTYQRWFRSFLIFFLAPLSLVALFNCLVDGSGLFRLNKGLKYAAGNLLEGKMVAGPLGGYDERKLQRLIVEHYPRRRDMIVIGSSRTMMLQKRFIHGDLDFFNHSMAGAGLEDYTAILGLYRTKGNLPRIAVFGVDPWIFNKNNGIPPYWKSISAYYEKMVAEVYGREIKVSHAEPNKYMQLVNLDYTRANYKYLRSGKRLYVTDSIDLDDFVREPDGSTHLPYNMRLKKDERSKPYSSDATPIRHLNHFVSLSDVDLFEKFVLYLQKKEVKVILLLLPFHPVAFKLFNDNPQYQVVLSLEKYLRDFGLRNHVMLMGSYDPGRYQLTGKDFFDDHHGHEIVAEKILAEYVPGK